MAVLALVAVATIGCGSADVIEVCREGVEMPLTQAMREEYEERFEQCVVDPKRKAQFERVITRMMKSRERYQNVATVARVPWYVIAVIHDLECDGRFDCHLHNGDPLRARTVQVPKGRPIAGRPPFTWEQSAIDAMTYKFAGWTDWSVGGTLHKLELYNGMGYRRLRVPIPSPYLWSGDPNLYTKGKFARDGVYDPNLVSQDLGAAVLLRRMVDQSLIELPATNPRPAPATPEAPGVDPKCEGVR